MLPQDIRKFIERTFASLGTTPQQLKREALLIREGHYCGHRYESDELTAVWFLEEGEVKFFGRDGDLVLVLQPEAEGESPRQAA